jgi:hypothetical protein
MKTLLKISVFAGIAVIGYGVYMLINEQIRLIFSYCYRIKNIAIRSFKKDNINLKIDVLLKNQSDIGLEIISYNFDIYLDGIKVFNVKDPDTHINWAARGVSLVSTEVAFNPTEVFNATNLQKLLSKSAFNYKQIAVRTKGIVSVKHGFIKAKNVPLDITMTIDEIMQDDPKLEVCTI